jgi:hypothetical protein
MGGQGALLSQERKETLEAPRRLAHADCRRVCSGSREPWLSWPDPAAAGVMPVSPASHRGRSMPPQPQGSSVQRSTSRAAIFAGSRPTASRLAHLRPRLMSNAENTAGKQRGRPFPKGQSGNPAGKPKGTRNAPTLALETLLDGQARFSRPKIHKALWNSIHRP